MILLNYQRAEEYQNVSLYVEVRLHFEKFAKATAVNNQDHKSIKV